MKIPIFGVLVTLALALAGLLAAPSAAVRAATYTWQGGGGNNDWGNGGNWVGGIAPPSDGTADLLFGSTSASFPSISSDYSINSLTWNAGANAYNFDSGPLTLGAGGFTQNAVNAQGFGAAVVLGADQTWTLASGAGALTFGNGVKLTGGPGNANHSLTINASTTTGSGNVINGNLTGGGGLSMTGTGILSLSGTASTYSGGTYVRDGTLAFDNAGALGTSTVTLGTRDFGKGELRATNTVTLSNRLTVGFGPAGPYGAISAAPGTTFTIAGNLSVTGILTFGSTGQTGVVTLTPSSKSTDSISTITVSSGTLRGGAVGTLGYYTGTVASTTVNAGATLDLNGFSTSILNLQDAGAVTTGGTGTTVLTVSGGSFSGAVSGPGA